MPNSVTEEVIQPVDVKKVFYSKNPRLARIIPNFIFNYLKRIVHEDDNNNFLAVHGHKRNLEFISAVIEEFKVTINIEGETNIPKTGRFVFAANHPLGGFDGMVLMKIISGYFDEFRFLVNDILMNLKNIQDLFIPINKHGPLAYEAVAQIEKAFESDIQILTFPAGFVSRKIRGQIIDLPWQKSFITKAVRYHRDIIPIHFSGRCSNFFYRLANLRKFLGIKANVEMLYLVDETYKHRNEHLIVKFGRPIPWETFNSSKKPLEWAKWVKEKVYALEGITHVPF